MEDKFAEKAKTWDENPRRAEMSDRFFSEILKNIEVKKRYKVLEFGCGTGLTGLKFVDMVDSLLMVDNSKAMLSVLEEKTKVNKIDNIEVLNGDITQMDIDSNSIDIILSLMVLHHIDDIPSVLNMFKRILKKGGYVVIGDLCKEDGDFHGIESVAHNGFTVDEIDSLFNNCNFSIQKIYDYYTVKKPDSSGLLKEYRQFILIAKNQ